MHTAVIQTNVWYSSSYLPTQLELESLPIFPRDQLTLMSFLESGAFGEVFEGVAKDITAPGTGNLKVDVKDPLLGIGDLIAICIDVARGCTYLEKIHFVHRDLAARNCLVSVKEYTSHSHKVKIGDFGLARDICKNDYYRKEGETLLPVRWMAPESLIDGVFTNQSDVWTTAISSSNLEVLQFVRSGGRLERPCSYPDDIYQLMLKCWTSEPYKRPSFWFIDSCLEHLEKRSTDIPGALGYYNDSYREYDISQGIVNQAFEGNSNSQNGI